jgi:hypothetical protein
MVVIRNNWSANSIQGIAVVFVEMFRGSTQIRVCPTKFMYLVSEALYPYFRNVLISDINNGFYCLLYDETTDKKNEKELQIQIRYFSEVYKVVRNHHLQTFFIKDGTGKKIARCLEESVENAQLPYYH